MFTFYCGKLDAHTNRCETNINASKTPSRIRRILRFLNSYLRSEAYSWGVFNPNIRYLYNRSFEISDVYYNILLTNVQETAFTKILKISLDYDECLYVFHSNPNPAFKCLFKSKNCMIYFSSPSIPYQYQNVFQNNIDYYNTLQKSVVNA